MMLGRTTAGQAFREWHALFKDPAFIPKYNMDWDETRERPMQRLRKVAQSGLVSVKDFFKNPNSSSMICDGTPGFFFCDGSGPGLKFP